MSGHSPAHGSQRQPTSRFAESVSQTRVIVIRDNSFQVQNSHTLYMHGYVYVVLIRFDRLEFISWLVFYTKSIFRIPDT